MQTSQIVNEARAMARRFIEGGRDVVRMPVFAYDDWREVYRRPADGASVSQFRLHQRRSFYLMQFLREAGVRVEPVPVTADAFEDWALASGHNLADGHDLAHAVGEYANRPEVATTRCQHETPPAEALAGLGPLFATITVYGEGPDAPEIMSVALHQADGSLLKAHLILAADHAPPAAMAAIEEFLRAHGPEKVFHDRTVRRPEFCADCNALLVNVASPEDVSQAGREG